MWVSRSEELDGPGLRFRIELGPRPATFADVIDAWRGDAAFRFLFVSLLAEAPFAAFRWETPPVVAASTSRPFEFVLLNDPGLSRRPDPDAFAEHFVDAPADGVVTFPNLRGDATLVVPVPLGTDPAYGHLAAFVREAPDRQRHALWQAVGEAMSRRVGTDPVWLSTAGAGVSWLHVRLDDRPKYYWFDPYRRLPPGR